MQPNNTPKSKIGLKHIIIIAAAVAVACAGILIAGYFANKALDDEYTTKEMDEVMDEIIRTKHFVSDWYSEISSGENGTCAVYLNEIRFGNNEYSLTFAGERLRAVYPRGERFFKLEYIEKIEFFEVDGKVRCRFYYGSSGEYTFTV